MAKKNVVSEGYCPKCGTQLRYVGEEIVEGGAHKDVDCPNKKCQWFGWEDYTLVFGGFYTMQEGEGRVGDIIKKGTKIKGVK